MEKSVELNASELKTSLGFKRRLCNRLFDVIDDGCSSLRGGSAFLHVGSLSRLPGTLHGNEPSSIPAVSLRNKVRK